MDTLQLLEKVNTFYSNSFSQLITITIALLGFGGIILPLLIQFLQSRIFRSEQKSLQAQIDHAIDEARAEMKSAIEAMFQVEKDKLQEIIRGEIQSLNTVIQEQFSSARAGTFFLQGVNNLRAKDYAQAARDYAFAAELYLTGKDELNGQRALSTFITSCIPFLNQTSFETVSELDSAIIDLIKRLEGMNENNRFYDNITTIKQEVEKGRKKPVLIS